MTLAQITLPVTYAWGVQHALLFSPQLAQRLGQLHLQYGKPDCLVTPRLTTDGRYMLTADILTAVVPGGYLHAMWSHADQSLLLPNVEVVPIADAIAILPPTNPE